MISRDKINEIFCMSDDFCKLYDLFIKANGLAPKRDKSKRKYHRDPRMSSAEIITIMILFHFVDSTLLRVCRNQHIHMHKVFKGIAQRGQCSMGWFYGLKLHLICNEMGELLSFMVTPGNVDDREPLKNKTFVELLFGKLVGDKILLRKRAIIETINDELKNIAQIEPEENGLIQLSIF